MTAKKYFVGNRYRIIGQTLSQLGGTVLDVGARDRVLLRHLDPSRTSYFSSDLSPGHDFQIDLERPVPFADGEFDHVVALDVMEHVEAIHDCFAELARTSARTLTVALPNIAVANKRWTFLMEGHLGGKYRLLPEHQGDRHRWLTIYPELNEFIEVQASQHGLELYRVFEEVIVTRLPLRMVVYTLLRLRVLRWGSLIERSVFVMKRPT